MSQNIIVNDLQAKLDIAILALQQCTKSRVSTETKSDVARVALRQVMPLWAYEFGVDYFDSLHEALICELSKLTDTSWHNDSLPSFTFGQFMLNEQEYHIRLTVGFDADSRIIANEFVFDLAIFAEDQNVMDVNGELRARLGLTQDNYDLINKVDSLDFEQMIGFLRKYGQQDASIDLFALLASELLASSK